MNHTAWLQAALALDIAAALVLGLTLSILARLRPHPRQKRPFKTQAHIAIYSALSLLGTIFVVALALGDGLKAALQLEQAWAARQVWPIQAGALLVVLYLLFGVVSLIAHQATDSLSPIVKRTLEHLEAAGRAYRAKRPVSEEQAQIRYSFAPE